MNVDDKELNRREDDKATTQKPQEDEEGDEEALVLLQFTDQDDANYCEQFSQKFKSISIEKKNPIIQIGNRVYSGEYVNNIGTYLFFEEDKESNKSQEANNAAADSAKQNFNFFGKSYKRLVLTRLFVEENPAAADASNENSK